MTEWTSSLQNDALRKYAREDLQVVELAVPLTTAVLQDDSVDVVNIPPGFVVKAAMMAASATLGSSCTAQLRIGSPSSSARAMNILIAGAAVTSAATIKISFIIGAAKVSTLPST